VARETLDVSHKLTMFVAQTITDLAAPDLATAAASGATAAGGGANAATSTAAGGSSSSGGGGGGGGANASSASSGGVAGAAAASGSGRRATDTAAVVSSGGGGGGGGDGGGSNAAARRFMEETLIHQPRGLREGLERAYGAMARELGVAAETIIAVPVRQYEQLGPSGLITSVVRALPIAVLRPVAGLAEGLSYTILGLRNSLDPETQQDEEDLWNVDFPLP
jgi:hypothetical protein